MLDRHEIDQHPFKPQSAIFADADEQTELLIWSTPDLCSYIRSSSSLEHPYPAKSTGILVLFDPHVERPGNVEVDDSAEVIEVDPSCNFSGGGPGAGASITFDVVNATTLSGSFEVRGDGGTFDAVRCDALFGAFPHLGKCH